MPLVDVRFVAIALLAGILIGQALAMGMLVLALWQADKEGRDA